VRLTGGGLFFDTLKTKRKRNGNIIERMTKKNESLHEIVIKSFLFHLTLCVVFSLQKPLEQKVERKALTRNRSKKRFEKRS